MANIFVRRALKQYGDVKANKPEVMRVIQGDGAGNVGITDVESMIYVRAQGQEGLPIIVRNERTQKLDSLPVLIGRDTEQPDVLQVLGIDLGAPILPDQIAATSNLLLHAPSHLLGGNDTIYIHSLQIIGLRPDTDGMKVIVGSGLIETPDGWILFRKSTIDLTSYKPATANKAKWVLVSVDDTGALAVTSGSEVDQNYLDWEHVPGREYDKFPCCLVRLYNGQVSISRAVANPDFHDARFAPRATGDLNVLFTGLSDGDTLRFDEDGNVFRNENPFTDSFDFGFVTAYDGTQETTISFDDGTYEFEITPTGSTWRYYRNGLLHTVTGAKTVTLSGSPPAAGLYYVYIDAEDGTLTASLTGWTLEDTKLPVAAIAWDNSLTPKYWLADERHSCAIKRRFHWEHHYADGTEIITAPALSGYTVQPSSPTDTDNTFGISASVLADEDLKLILSALTDPDGTSADYVVMYRTGASAWDWEASPMPYRYTAGGYIQYDDGGTMTQGQAIKYYNSYLILTGYAGAARFVIISGQGEFDTLVEAQAEVFAGLTKTGLPILEYVAVFQLTWRTSAAYTTKGKCRLESEPKAILASGVSTETAGAASGKVVQTWYIDGALAAQSDVGMTFVAPFAITITNITLHVKDKGSSGSTVVDINKGGTSLFPTSTKPTVAYNDADNYDTRAPDTTAVSADDLITVDIDSVATGAGSATVIFYGVAA